MLAAVIAGGVEMEAQEPGHLTLATLASSGAPQAAGQRWEQW